jgi:predicted XRE-type DNA-binding protein
LRSSETEILTNINCITTTAWSIPNLPLKKAAATCLPISVSREREQLKAHRTLQIYRVIKSRRLTQLDARAILGIKQPHVSFVMRYGAGNFSIEQLMDSLIAFGRDVEMLDIRIVGQICSAL